MNKRLVVAILSSVLLILGSVFFVYYHNATNPQKPLASNDGGFYEEAFSLKLSTFPGNKIYYTTDGSTPTPDSQIYEGEIRIEDRSQEENVYQNIQNVVRDWQSLYIDPTPVPKGTVIRAISVSPQGNVSEVFTQTYFVGLELPENTYAVSLVFDKDVMFGDEGICVTGKAYDDWYLSETQEGDQPAANFDYKTEVPVLLEFMDTDGDILNQQVGIRVQGSSSRQYRYKRFIMVARDEYSGSNVLDEDIFGVKTHSVMLRHFSLDAMMSDFVSDRAVTTQKSKRVAVYLNGEFWYNAYMMERYDNRFYEEYYQAKDIVEAEDGSDLELGKDTIPTYVDIRNFVKNSDRTSPEFWAQIQEFIDVQSYIDFVVINYYVGNIDVHEWHNSRMWRAADTNLNDVYRDTRWKWNIYDVDAIQWSGGAFDTDDVAPINVFLTSGSHPAQSLASTTFFTCMMENPEFRQLFALSFMDIVNNNFSVERAEKVLLANGEDLEYLNGYFAKRPTYAPQHLAELMGLQGTLETVSITVSNADGGSITVNTSQIDLQDGQWEGKYFTDYPITITATPNPGYRFIGWKGSIDTTDTTITIPVDGGVGLEAVFAP